MTNGAEQPSVILEGLLTLRAIGFFDFLLPFILFFAIVYGALDKTKVFGENKRDINSVVALVIALVATTTAMVTKALAGFLPWIGFIALVVVSFLMIVALVVGDVSHLANIPYFKEAMVIVVAIFIAIVFVYAVGLEQLFPQISLSATDIALIIMLVVGVIAFAAFMRSSGPPVRAAP
jgi:hypothetical protein